MSRYLNELGKGVLVVMPITSYEAGESRGCPAGDSAGPRCDSRGIIADGHRHLHYHEYETVHDRVHYYEHERNQSHDDDLDLW